MYSSPFLGPSFGGKQLGTYLKGRGVKVVFSGDTGLIALVVATDVTKYTLAMLGRWSRGELTTGVFMATTVGAGIAIVAKGGLTAGILALHGGDKLTFAEKQAIAVVVGGLGGAVSGYLGGLTNIPPFV